MTLIEPGTLKLLAGRKTDVLDCQWLQQLPTFGLLSGACRPDDQVCVWRSYLRQRDMLVRYAGPHLQHMQKAVLQMNGHLPHGIDDLTGGTGLRIIEASLAGARDPHTLAAARHERCQHDEATIAVAWQGHWREAHLLALTPAVARYRFSHQTLDEVDRHLEASLEPFADKRQGEGLEARPRQRKRSNHEPRVNVRQYLFQLTGMALMTSDGLRPGSLAFDLIAEIGMDMRPWPTEKHFASWLCRGPGNKKTGGRLLSGRTRTHAGRAARMRRRAADALTRSQTAWGAFYRRLKARLGPANALTATAHQRAKMVYTLLTYGTASVDRGAEDYAQQDRERALKNLQRRAQQMGFALVPMSLAPAAAQSPALCPAR